MPMLSTGMIDTLVKNTIAVKTRTPDELDGWRETLTHSVQFALQTKRPDEEAFLSALLAILDDKDFSLPSENPYQQHIEQVKDSIAKYFRSEVDYKKLFDMISAMYKYAGAASLRELLRRTGATEEQVAAIIGEFKKSEDDILLLDDQIDIIVENTVEVKTAVPEKLEEWHEKIKQAIIIAEEDGNDNEKAFFQALLTILEDTDIILSDANPYYPYLGRILESIRAYKLNTASRLPEDNKPLVQAVAQAVSGHVKRDDKMTKLSHDMIETMVKTTIAVKTIAEANLDDWRDNIRKSIEIAAKNERIDDQYFFVALLGVLNDEEALLPDTNPYQRHLQQVIDSIEQFEGETSVEKKAIGSFASIYQDGGEGALREKLRKSGASTEQSDAIVAQIMKLNHTPDTAPMLPRILVDSMVQTTIRVKTQSPEKLKDWRAELQRNMESAIINKKIDAHEFFKTLLALLNEPDITLPENNPYLMQLKQVQDTLLNLTDQEDTESEEPILIGEDKPPTEHELMPELEWLSWLEQNTLAVLTVSPEYIEDWKKVLQDEMMNSHHALADPKITFLAALYNLVHNRLPALDALNPYYPNWQNVLIQLSRFKSGRRMKPEFLDKCVETTIAVCTKDINGHEAWRQRLKKLYAMAVGRKDAHEEDWFQALLDICEGRLPSIGFDNPYVAELQRIQAEIANFHTLARREREVTRESHSVNEAVNRTIFNPRALKIESLPEPIRSEFKGLLDGLEIALGKVAHDNKNDVEIVREEIGRAIDEATKHDPDLKRLKIRGDSLRVAAANLQNISPIINKIASLLLRLGE